MAKKAVVKRNWPKKNGALLATCISGISEKLKGNKNFKNLKVSTDDMDAQATVMDGGYNNRKNGLEGREAYKTALANSDDMLQTVATDISEQADGNTTWIASAGFDFTKTGRGKTVVPETPQPPKLENVNGVLHITIKKVKGATSYCIVVFLGEVFPITITGSQLDIDPKAKVIIIPAGSTREMVHNIPLMTKVTVQVLAQNAAGKSGFSAPISIDIA